MLKYYIVLLAFLIPFDVAPILIAQERGGFPQFTKDGYFKYSKENLQAVAQVKKLGGVIDMGFFISTPCRYADIDFSGTKVTSKDLECLKDYPCISRINFANTAVDDKAIKHLRPFLPFLYEASFEGTKLTDAGLRELKGFDIHILSLSRTNIRNLGLLKGLPLLQNLDVSETKVKDEDLLALKGALVGVLYLSGCNITDRGLDNLREMEYLTRIYLDRTKVTDMGVRRNLSHRKEDTYFLSLAETSITNEALKNFPLQRLESLNLSKTKINNDGLRFLSNMKELTELSLSNNAVSLKGIQQMKNLPSLRTIDLRETQILRDDLPVIQRMFPNAKILSTVE